MYWKNWDKANESKSFFPDKNSESCLQESLVADLCNTPNNENKKFKVVSRNICILKTCIFATKMKT